MKPVSNQFMRERHDIAVKDYERVIDEIDDQIE